MAHAENTVTIQRPIDVVFAFLLDGANNPRWRPAVIAIEHVSGDTSGVGATYKQTLKGPGGRPIAGDYQITECQPNTRLAFRVIAGPARPLGVYTLAPAGDDACTVAFALDFQPTGVMRLMDPIIAQTMRSEVAMLANLKSYLEGQLA